MLYFTKNKTYQIICMFTGGAGFWFSAASSNQQQQQLNGLRAHFSPAPPVSCSSCPEYIYIYMYIYIFICIYAKTLWIHSESEHDDQKHCEFTVNLSMMSSPLFVSPFSWIGGNFRLQKSIRAVRNIHIELFKAIFRPPGGNFGHFGFKYNVENIKYSSWKHQIL